MASERLTSPPMSSARGLPLDLLPLFLEHLAADADLTTREGWLAHARYLRNSVALFDGHKLATLAREAERNPHLARRVKVVRLQGERDGFEPVDSALWRLLKALPNIDYGKSDLAPGQPVLTSLHRLLLHGVVVQASAAHWLNRSALPSLSSLSLDVAYTVNFDLLSHLESAFSASDFPLEVDGLERQPGPAAIPVPPAILHHVPLASFLFLGASAPFGNVPSIPPGVRRIRVTTATFDPPYRILLDALRHPSGALNQLEEMRLPPEMEGRAGEGEFEDEAERRGILLRFD
ncbi:hypothetical protein JCM8097_003156 [Rhodosporidiobolus ruineniae]